MILFQSVLSNFYDFAVILFVYFFLIATKAKGCMEERWLGDIIFLTMHYFSEILSVTLTSPHRYISLTVADEPGTYTFLACRNRIATV